MKRDWNYRRHHALRKQQHAYRVVSEMWGVGRTGHSTDEDAHRMARKLRDNLAVCSCSMCRNPRRSDWSSGKERLTIQERRVKSITLDFDFRNHK